MAVRDLCRVLSKTALCLKSLLPRLRPGQGETEHGGVKIEFTLNTTTMQKLKKLPFVLAFVVTLFAAACSEIEVDPRTDGDDDKTEIPLPPPSKSQSTSSDSTLIG